MSTETIVVGTHHYDDGMTVYSRYNPGRILDLVAGDPETTTTVLEFIYLDSVDNLEQLAAQRDREIDRSRINWFVVQEPPYA